MSSGGGGGGGGGGAIRRSLSRVRTEIASSSERETEQSEHGAWQSSGRKEGREEGEVFKPNNRYWGLRLRKVGVGRIQIHTHIRVAHQSGVNNYEAQ